MKIYTKTGDKGSTSLVSGERVPKDDVRVEAYGTVDELTAVVAYFRDSMPDGDQRFEPYREDLRAVLNTLMDVAANLAMGNGGRAAKVKPVDDSQVARLEQRIDEMGAMLKPLSHFTIPGGHALVSLSHVCRTVCRRAERCAVRAAAEHEVDSNSMAFLNRLSDYLYQIGRLLTQLLDVKEEYWIPKK